MTVDYKLLANSYISRLTPYVPGKPIEELEREFGITSAIKLASNENALGASPKAILAAESALQRLQFYPESGCYELKQRLSSFLNVAPNQLTIGNGSENILELIVKSYLGPDDSAIVSEYAFITISLIIKSLGGKLIEVPAAKFNHDISKMIASIDHKTRIIFIVNPNNPTGTYTTRDDFKTLLESIPPHVIVVVDEAYHEYIDNPEYPNTLALLNSYPNVIITRTFSKIYGLAALRLGYAVSSADIADILNRARLPFNVNSIAMNAACAALLDKEHVERTLCMNKEGMQQLEEGLKKLFVEYIPSLGNFITIHVKESAMDLYEKLLYQGVIVRPLVPYNMPAHIRVTIGTFEQNERFLGALQRVM